MKNSMTYKGYTARIEFDDRDDIFVGRVLGIEDVITFHGTTVNALRADFRHAIDFYLSTNPLPQKPASGKLMLRIPSEVHTAALIAAQSSGKSLNQWAASVLKEAAHV
ncbi:MAG: type II toxin-antitoxin system HicB family antitoxin [Gallionellaceae bacterium]|nr:MAG: type II toxin-antitoxin system HicB family antitoxin [Gallionellaceae bacterium]